MNDAFYCSSCWIFSWPKSHLYFSLEFWVHIYLYINHVYLYTSCITFIFCNDKKNQSLSPYCTITNIASHVVNSTITAFYVSDQYPCKLFNFIFWLWSSYTAIKMPCFLIWFSFFLKREFLWFSFFFVCVCVYLVVVHPFSQTVSQPFVALVEQTIVLLL